METKADHKRLVKRLMKQHRDDGEAAVQKLVSVVGQEPPQSWTPSGSPSNRTWNVRERLFRTLDYHGLSRDAVIELDRQVEAGQEASAAGTFRDRIRKDPGAASVFVQLRRYIAYNQLAGKNATSAAIGQKGLEIVQQHPASTSMADIYASFRTITERTAKAREPPPSWKEGQPPLAAARPATAGVDRQTSATSQSDDRDPLSSQLQGTVSLSPADHVVVGGTPLIRRVPALNRPVTAEPVTELSADTQAAAAATAIDLVSAAVQRDAVALKQAGDRGGCEALVPAAVTLASSLVSLSNSMARAGGALPGVPEAVQTLRTEASAMAAALDELRRHQRSFAAELTRVSALLDQTPPSVSTAPDPGSRSHHPANGAFAQDKQHGVETRD